MCGTCSKPGARLQKVLHQGDTSLAPGKILSLRKCGLFVCTMILREGFQKKLKYFHIMKTKFFGFLQDFLVCDVLWIICIGTFGTNCVESFPPNLFLSLFKCYLPTISYINFQYSIRPQFPHLC